MKTLHRMLLHAITASFVSAAEPATPAMSASELAAKLNTFQQDGSSHVRLKMEIQGATKTVLQLQIKQRRTSASTEIVYQVLWPKERMGESVLLRKFGNQAATGSVFVPPGTVRTLDATQMKEPLFGSDLSYADVIENFFAWERQTIVGTEIVDRVSFQVLESKPGGGERSPYAAVRSWIDVRRLVPLRVEKYLASGQLVRRIDTTRVVTSDGRHLPANLTVSSPQKGSSTELDGSRLKRGVTYADREFTPEGLKEVTSPRSAPE
ncbi:MAG: outer membrane lipoprotein-sorting protein [Prosthecobacter sp.]|nr:outer membrane lipoprotein-sorting protein [Prosthecobacter sp.]